MSVLNEGSRDLGILCTSFGLTLHDYTISITCFFYQIASRNNNVELSLTSESWSVVV